MKTIERLTICILLIILAFAVCGCKEKAEASEDWQTEPNEPLQRLTELFEQMLEQEGRLIDVVGLCIKRIETIEKREPNELEPMKYSLPIPTWPDYIELDKELVIHGGAFETDYIQFSKGTKIYFKN